MALTLRSALTADHFGFEGTLASIAERIREQQGRRQKVAEALAGLRGVAMDGVEGVVEPSLINQVEMDPLVDLTVGGVDGGLLEQQLHGLDLILVRALAAIFHYRNAVLERAEYFPNEVPPPKLVDVAEPLDAKEFELLTGMERQLAELEVAADAVQESGAGLLLLDGSVVPQYVDRFPHSTLLLERYQKLIEAYTGLYRVCAKSGALLAGAVKDSRGGRFVDILRHGVLPAFGDLGLEQKDLATLQRSRDTALLDHLLGVGERTPAFTYAEKPASYVLRDLGVWATKVHAFYVKTVPFDRPLRVEFVDCGGEVTKTAGRIASLVYALSSHHDAFGLPSVLIEADACARLAEEDLCIVRDSIADRLGPSTLLDLRRHRKPF
ncbi:MAG: DNA double-strand break repair nuclease NurA [Hadesarchaea archaeon]|nr:DNA double-strand break repair nuclease NurA [Hadesarchaea archaeon]